MVAHIEGRDGTLWDKEEPEGYGKKVNMSDHMKEYRFKKIRSYMGYLFADENKKNEGDPWWPFSAGIDTFNANRETVVLEIF